MNKSQPVLKLRIMLKHLKNLKTLAFAMLIISNNVFAEVECIPQSQVDVNNIKPITNQKQPKSTTTKTTLKGSKSTKYEPGYLGVLKLLIPAGLR